MKIFENKLNIIEKKKLSLYQKFGLWNGSGHSNILKTGLEMYLAIAVDQMLISKDYYINA